MQIIAEKYYTARKKHRCDFCYETIEPGTEYHDQFNKYGGVYHWKSCLRCHFLFKQLYDYIDPYDGMLDATSFAEGLSDFGRQFVCDQCEHYKDIGDPQDPPNKYRECDLDNCVEYECINKIVECLKYNELSYIRSDCKRTGQWELVLRESPIRSFPER